MKCFCWQLKPSQVMKNSHMEKENCFLHTDNISCFVELVDDKQLQQGTIYPPLSSLRNCSLAIARKLAKYAYDKGIASRLPPPKEPISDEFFDR